MSIVIAIIIFGSCVVTQKLSTPLIPRAPKMISEWKDTPYQWRFVEIVPSEHKRIVHFKSFTSPHVSFDSDGPQPPQPIGPEATHHTYIVDKCVIKSLTSLQVEINRSTHLIEVDHFSLSRDPSLIKELLKVRGWHD